MAVKTFVTFLLLALTVVSAELPTELHPFFQGHCGSSEMVCEQLCIQRHEGYLCDCKKGYQLEVDGYSCKVHKRNKKPEDAEKEVSKNKPSYFPPTTTTSAAPKTEAETSESSKQTLDYVDVETLRNALIGHTDDEYPYGPDYQADEYYQSEETDSQPKTSQKNHKQTMKDKIQRYLDNVDSMQATSSRKGKNRREIKRQCSRLDCQNDGNCIYDDALKRVRCQCELGYTGDSCKEEQIVKYPQFRGTGYLAFPRLHHAGGRFTINIVFRPDKPTGVLLYSGDLTLGRQDFFSLAIVNGYPIFRFDCGSGQAHINSTQKVNMGQWNEIMVQRVDNSGFMSLNKGMAVRGIAKGEFTRISLKRDLFLGGFPDKQLLHKRAGLSVGFNGCVEKLEINSRSYDFRRQPFVGDAIYGLDVDECSASVCKGVRCLNNGSCQPQSPDKHVCLCPLGFVGDNCERAVSLVLPYFSGNSYLRHQGLMRTSLTNTEIEILFKPVSSNGVILYNGYTWDRRGDFFSLALVNGYLEFRFDLGSGPAEIRSRDPLLLNHWHYVHLSRTGRYGIMEIDKQAPVEGYAGGAYVQLTLMLDLFIGGHRNYDETSAFLKSSKSFEGCIQKISINGKKIDLVKGAIDGVNIDSCRHPCDGMPCQNNGICRPVDDNYRCDCLLGFKNTNCEDEIPQDIKVPLFNGNTFLSYIDNDIVRRVSGANTDLKIRLRPEDPNGLILWTGAEIVTGSSNYLGIGLVDGYVRVRLNLGGGEKIIQFSKYALQINEWYDMRLQRFGQIVLLEINTKEVVEGMAPGTSKELQTDNVLYVGGTRNVAEKTKRLWTTGFKGCIEYIKMATDYSLDIVGKADSGQNLDSCDNSKT
ncbi:pikachurin-like [Lineus longissimus]|uniref:pikachurin-like n=1 Tax=Lineus longissimus TaxID=88925 RepID=UPI002B4CDD1B